MNWFKKQFGKYFEKNKPKEFEFTPEQSPNTKDNKSFDEIPEWKKHHKTNPTFVIAHGYSLSRKEKRRERTREDKVALRLNKQDDWHERWLRNHTEKPLGLE